MAKNNDHYSEHIGDGFRPDHHDHHMSMDESNHFIKSIDPKAWGLAQQVKHLKSFVAYYSFPEGDVPVSIVATSIKEAAKLSSMPGILGHEAVEPMQIKNEGKTVGVAMPVQMIDFNTIVIPEEARTAGARATPYRYEVRNGDNVIFEAYTPFGYEFDGWYKTGSDVRLSSSEIASIDVYDNYVTRIQYEARFNFRPTLRSGRYLDLTRGNLITFEFPNAIPSKPPYGRAIWDGGTISSYHCQISNFTPPTEEEDGTITFLKDPTITQPGNFSMKGSFTFSPIGINIVVDMVPLDNPFGYVKGSVITLQWLNTI